MFALQEKVVFPLLLAVLTLIAVGLQVPNIQAKQNEAHDEKLSQDITTISREIDTNFYTTGEIPSSLDKLKLNTELELPLKEYEYVPDKANMSYKLCATFKAKGDGNSSSYYSVTTSETNPYKHDSGRQCFTYTNENYFNFGPDSSQSEDGFDFMQSDTGDEAVKSDIGNLASELEYYFNDFSYYPTQLQLYDSKWRTANMTFLDEKRFAPALGSTYTYTPMPAGCKEKVCKKFELSGKLEAASPYIVKSHN